MRVLLYNVQFAHPIYMMNGWKQRLNGIVKKLKDPRNEYDILVFTEVFYAKAQNEVLQSLQDMYPYHVNSPRRFYKPISGGLLILSRFPILQHFYSFYEQSKASDQFASKGFLYAKIQLSTTGGGGRLDVVHLVATHIQAWEEHMVVRMAQLNQLKKWIKRQKFFQIGKDQVLVLGDFNMDFHQSHHRMIVEQIFGPDCTWPQLVGRLKYSCDSKRNQLRGFDGTANSTEYMCRVCTSTPNNGLCELTCKLLGHKFEKKRKSETKTHKENDTDDEYNAEHDSFCPNCPSLLLDYAFIPGRQETTKFSIKVRRWLNPKPQKLKLWKFGWVSRPYLTTRDLSDHYPVEIQLVR